MIHQAYGIEVEHIEEVRAGIIILEMISSNTKLGKYASEQDSCEMHFDKECGCGITSHTQSE